ncbi:MAG: D-alanine--D-alanine ligase [Deltaproteobacteria bacterium]|nr:D-alanine--D-alanine ligase [Deltaproteobacteria bacterium]
MKVEELKQKKIAVLMGGISSEREISLLTGNAVLKALCQGGYQAFAIDPGRDLAERLIHEGVEVVFVALHGRFGEDGTVQGLLELLRIPYTGSGVLASSLAMDKEVSKRLFLCHGIPTPDFLVVKKDDDAESFRNRIEAMLPVVIKPVREGSTLGVSIIAEGRKIDAGLEEAFRFDSWALVEKFIAGEEITVGVLDGEALPVIQVRPKSGFYDYVAKYTAGRTEYLLPAPIDANLYRRAQELAMAAYQALHCQGAARVDFMLGGGRLYCLEVNTIPGMTETSLLPKAAGHAGISFGELVTRMLMGASLKV